MDGLGFIVFLFFTFWDLHSRDGDSAVLFVFFYLRVFLCIGFGCGAGLFSRFLFVLLLVGLDYTGSWRLCLIGISSEKSHAESMVEATGSS